MKFTLNAAAQQVIGEITSLLYGQEHYTSLDTVAEYVRQLTLYSEGSVYWLEAYVNALQTARSLARQDTDGKADWIPGIERRLTRAQKRLARA